MLSEVNQVFRSKQLCVITLIFIIHYRVEEYWESQLEGLEQIVATRQIPCIHILLSLDKLDENVLG